MLYLSIQGRYLDILTMYRYGVEKLTYFCKLTGPRSLSVERYSGEHILVVFFHERTLRKLRWTCQMSSIMEANALPWQSSVKCWQICLAI